MVQSCKPFVHFGDLPESERFLSDYLEDFLLYEFSGQKPIVQ